MSRHRSSVGLRWPSKRIAALHRLPIRSVWAARCALRCAPMAARSLRHLIGDATLASPPRPDRKRRSPRNTGDPRRTPSHLQDTADGRPARAPWPFAVQG
ncbi:hypothetical protein [Verminephrobacter eiseniae]|uniref:hypothetical protein n=1 Tax=Verminephrobacter eiseniae TaxID=364317 RepID=UPI002237CBC2|nr:hypothetical protein [Verminephrobacter eiseniae]